jgi:hypothetical protein
MTMMGYGYENAAGDRISALIDMINGGGPGRSGGTFEGGGILSLLANAVAKPYGSVRERPGHTPMGAAAPTSMDVLRPVATEPVDAAVLSDDDVEGAINRAGATDGRTFREEDLAVLRRLHPDLAALFSGMRPGDPLSPQQAMFLDAARVGFDVPLASAAPELPRISDPRHSGRGAIFQPSISSIPGFDTAYGTLQHVPVEVGGHLYGIRPTQVEVGGVPYAITKDITGSTIITDLQTGESVRSDLPDFFTPDEQRDIRNQYLVQIGKR